MKQGIHLIYQGALELDGWVGYADFIRRVETPSRNLGAWSYEVVDTKLARETKGTTILQLALYSEVVGIIQGDAPEFFYVVTPYGEERYRLAEYASYYRLVKRGLGAAVTQDPVALAAAHYPEPVEYCDVCRWERECKEKRRADDHLSLVAGISRLQRRELEALGITTLAGLAQTPLPIRADRGSEESYHRVREQARVQLDGRVSNQNIHELLLPIKAGEGLALLPEPTAADLFLDLEGDPYARADGGREYLFGIVSLEADGSPRYRRFWATTDEEEKQAFETVMDMISAARGKTPELHVYHYAPYEQTAFKRLMGRYATRQDEMDDLLRGGCFVDLHTVLKQSLRASVEKYSIKDMEKFYGFTRTVELRQAGDRRAFIERCLEIGARDLITEAERMVVEGYNADDCVSTLRLRNWLEELRAGLVAKGTEVPRPTRQEEPPKELTEAQARVRELMDALLAGLPVTGRNSVEQARWILAHLQEYHRREDKVCWWEFFRLQALPIEDYLDEPRAVAGLSFVERVKPGKGGAHTDRYRYLPQDCDIHSGDDLYDRDGKFGAVVEQDRGARTLDIKKRRDRAAQHPTALFAHTFIGADTLKDALQRVAAAVVADRMESAGRYRAAWVLLNNEPPRLRAGAFAPNAGENAVEFAARVVTQLDGTVLPIQGPPGAGKTFTGAHMICALVGARRRVGVIAPSHSVIDNLLRKVQEEATKQGLAVVCGHKDDKDSDDIVMFDDPGDALAALRGGEVHVLGGTAWLWAAEGATASVDVLVCDEAGQMCLADLIAASGAADSIVLLGDPQQLEQVQQGSHPDGVGVSALAHILGDHLTIPPDRGIFLDETWRMHPSICAFCSEVFYEGRLHSRAGLEQQALTGTRFEGAGLWMVEVEHGGNRNDSPEEVEAVLKVVDELLWPRSNWVNDKGTAQPMTGDQILVVSPYNRQVGELSRQLAPRGVRVGTVDKFQGREAAVVIYSMASSSASESSRGMEFLYSLSRLNVATSRARCATILVASPLLFEPECKSPRQMRLANALCRYVEMARRVNVGTGAR